MTKKEYTSLIVEDRDKIHDFISQFSIEMTSYIDEHAESIFFLFYKTINHSDLISGGKATSKNHLDSNILYYIKKSDMEQIEERTEKPFQTAKQSCIGIADRFYDLIGMPNPRTITNESGNRQYLVNDYSNVYIEKNNLKYFTSEYTIRILDRLNKKYKKEKWENYSLELADGFTPIQVHCAVHGLGTSQDIEFKTIRHNLFKGDSFMMLGEKQPNGIKNIFLLFDKNPLFYNIIGESNSSFLRYQEMTRRRLINHVSAQTRTAEEEEEITRALQSRWRDELAKEMMCYTQTDRVVMCPFTYMQANYDELGTLYRASHIKAFSDPNTLPEEKYDINNGLLLCSNVDSLFDKHLITVSEDKELIFSYLLDQNPVLKQQLFLTQPIFKGILNEKRMKYLEYHREIFKQLEEQRKTGCI